MDKRDAVQMFRVADLTAKRIDNVRGAGLGSVGYLGPDQDPDDFTPITPVVMSVKALREVAALDDVDVAQLDADILDTAALNIGREVLAGKFFPGSALCTIDMATCRANERISPLASAAESLTNVDLVEIRHQLKHAIEAIDRLDDRLG